MQQRLALFLHYCRKMLLLFLKRSQCSVLFYEVRGSEIIYVWERISCLDLLSRDRMTVGPTSPLKLGKNFSMPKKEMQMEQKRLLWKLFLKCPLWLRIVYIFILHKCIHITYLTAASKFASIISIYTYNTTFYIQ